MIYEVITYDIKPSTTPEAEKRYAEAYEHRRKYSELAAFWHTDIGPLNQLVAVWPYESLAELEKVRAAVRKDSNWPPNIKDFLISERSDIVTLAPFSPPIKPGRMGPFFEMRTYTLAQGELPVVLENWEKALPGRLEVGPVCAVWYSEFGAMHRWTHIWPYPALDKRTEARSKVVASGVWPPGAVAKKEGRRVEVMIAQENKLLLPAAFSPLQ